MTEYATLTEKYLRDTGMIINIEKSILAHNEFPRELVQKSREILAYPTKPLGEGFKYLGFFLKPNFYAFKDWMWLFQKVEARVSSWEKRFLSRGGGLVLVKVVLQSIPVYWASIAYIPKGIITKIWKACFTFLWTTSK